MYKDDKIFRFKCYLVYIKSLFVYKKCNLIYF